MKTSFIENARETVRVLKELKQLAPALRYKMADDDEVTSIGAVFEDAADRFSDNIVMLYDDRRWTYYEFNAEVNQLAHVLHSKGIKRGDTVALVMENRPEYVLTMIAVVKLGAGCSLINHRLTGAGLVHCLQATDAKLCVFGGERRDVLDEVRSRLSLDAEETFLWFADETESDAPSWALDAREEMQSASRDNLPITRTLTAGETALYVFTSGTTGLPKAAVMPHRRILGAAQGVGRMGFRIQPTDRLYLCLPIYHITGMGPGLCAFMVSGASVVLRRRFSGSQFWPEVQRYQANCFVYVGELCRYLATQEICEEELNNPLEKLLGNGLRPDVWDDFKARFGISRICEIYGSSEGNVSFVNILNKDRTIGAATTPVMLARYDIENDLILRNAAGFAMPVQVGEAGLLLGEISSKSKFDGYKDPAATERKIVRDVQRADDQWFNTGDLVRQIDVGFALGLKHFQFVDRTGDTFRWRAENVSTNEVAEVLNGHAQIALANVYGVEVPGVEGRAGMVAFALDESVEFDVDAFASLVEEQLPVYARPVFVRVQQALDSTGTFKLLKGELRKQAFHPSMTGGDKLWVLKPGAKTYEPLDSDFYSMIVDGAAGY